MKGTNVSHLVCVYREAPFMACNTDNKEFAWCIKSVLHVVVTFTVLLWYLNGLRKKKNHVRDSVLTFSITEITH